MRYSEYILKYKEFMKFYQVTFKSLLVFEEWESKSNEILNNENFCCSKCKAIWNPDRISHKVENDVSFKKIKDKWLTDSEFKEWNSQMKNFPLVDIKVYPKYFQMNKLPWEYPDDALETMCDKCHFEKIKQNKIEIRDEDMNLVKEINICYRCKGTGYIKKYDYINSGKCFDCNGDGYVGLYLEFNS